MEVKYSKDYLGRGESTNILDPKNLTMYFVIFRKTTKRIEEKKSVVMKKIRGENNKNI